MKSQGQSINKLTGPILVTGASGFVGSHVVKALVNLGLEVHVLVRKTSNLSRLKEVEGKFKIHFGDLTDKVSVEKVAAEVNPKGIFHLGVASIVSGVGAGSETMIATNLVGTINLIDSTKSLNYDFFVMTGSFLEYGFKANPIKENDLCEPAEIYGITKLAGTLYGQSTARINKKPIVIFRLFTPYGPENEPARLTHKIISNSLKGADISLTSPKISRDFIYIDDVVELLLQGASKASDCSGEIFNAGSGVKTTLDEVVNVIIEKIKSKSLIKWGDFRAVSYDSDSWQSNMDKTFKYFSWRPKVNLHDGLEKTIQYYKQFGR